MKLSNETVKQVKTLCDDSFFSETASKFSSDGAKARYMISKYRELAEDAALLRRDVSLADKISEENKALILGENARKFYGFSDLPVPEKIKNMVE